MHLWGPSQPVDDLLDLYLVDREPVGGRPWVLANMVGGLDGSAAVGGRVGARLADRIDNRRLSLAFTVLVLVVAVYTAIRALPPLL